jgi:hypothetical protein
MYKTLIVKDAGLHRELKKLAADMDVPIVDLVERFIREGIQRIRSKTPHYRLTDREPISHDG